ncbi:hypothetical protein BH11CYA1_BH11CYA1_38020 [soil metagenome]
MSSDSHSDNLSHSSAHGDDHGHDSHDSHAVATDVIPETSAQDMILKALTICVAGLLYFMAFSWMGVPLPEAGHGTGSEHSSEHGAEAGTSEHGPEHSSEHSPEHH